MPARSKKLESDNHFFRKLAEYEQGRWCDVAVWPVVEHPKKDLLWVRRAVDWAEKRDDVFVTAAQQVIELPDREHRVVRQLLYWRRLLT